MSMGRPRVFEGPTTKVSVVVPTETARWLRVMAAEREVSVSELVDEWARKARPEGIQPGPAVEAPPLGATEPQTGISSAPPMKTATICLSLYVERNSKFIRGKKKVWEKIETYHLPPFGMKRLREGEYELTIPYENDADLDEQVNELLSELARAADDRNCFLQECDASEKGGERSW